MIIAATGHRPDKLGGYSKATRYALACLAFDYLCKNKPAKVITGMALGWDQAVAAASMTLGIPFIAAVPFDGQDRRWPTESRERYARLISAAECVEIVSTPPCDAVKAMQRRNEWMVDRAGKMMALWDGSWGGTFNCVRCAEKKGVPIDNLWDRWTLPEDVRELLG